MKTQLISLLLATLMWTGITADAATLFDGYAGMKWGTDMHTVIRNYPKLKMGKTDNDTLFTQENPNKEVALRTFTFRDNKLVAVSVKFNPQYINKTGWEKLLKIHQKSYGEGTIDRSGAPHMISCVWDTPQTKIIYLYAPKRPDMTGFLYQFKEKQEAQPRP